MQDWLAAQTIANPSGIALTYRGEAWSYQGLQTLASRYAAYLDGYRLLRGQRVAVLMPNTPEYVALIHAIIRVGGVLVPLNTRLTAPELRYQLEQTDSSFLITHTDTHTLAQSIVPSDCHLIMISAMVQADPSYPSADWQLDDLAAIVFTSGTSGKPKGATLSIGNFYHSALGSAQRIGKRPTDKWLTVLPLYHVGGLSIVFRAALYGITIALHERFDTQPVHTTLQQDHITLVSLVPTMLYRLLELGETHTWQRSLRLILLGGAAASPDLLAQAAALDLPVATTYGLTEATSQVATALPSAKYGTVGKPLLFTEVRVVDAMGADVPHGTYGEIVVRGKTVMQGYWNNPDATAQALRNGELYTGDIGYLDADGDLWLVQRRSDLIISGGENIYPAEIEAILKQHSSVQDVAVIGLSHPEWGQQVAAAVVLKPDSLTSATDLGIFCRQYLAGYKVPRIFRFVDALPYTASGKLHRSAVMELFADDNQ